VKTLRKLSSTLDADDDKGVIAAVAVSLVIISAIVAGYYIYHVFNQKPEGYTTIYLLDENGQALNYPDTLVVNQNHTFYLWVENHEGTTLPCEVQLKITNETVSLFPVQVEPANTYTKSLANGEKWETQANITMNAIGSYTIIFELWAKLEGEGYSFTGNMVVLHINAVSQS
jgi:uncharacterized membrane protein